MKPSSPNPSGQTHTKSKGQQFGQPWSKCGKCPRGTIPVIRTQERYGRINAAGVPAGIVDPSVNIRGLEVCEPSSSQSNAVRFKLDISYVLIMCINYLNFVNYDRQNAHVFQTGERYTGVHAHVNIWKPAVEANGQSNAKLWLMSSDQSDDIDLISVGWMVQENFPIPTSSIHHLLKSIMVIPMLQVDPNWIYPNQTVSVLFWMV